MAFYRVMLEGNNFRIEENGELKSLGFYQNIYLESSTPEQAELDAVELAKASKDLRDAVKNPKDDPPMLYLAEIAELDNLDGIEVRVQGRVFFDEAGNDEE